MTGFYKLPNDHRAATSTTIGSTPRILLSAAVIVAILVSGYLYSAGDSSPSDVNAIPTATAIKPGGAIGIDGSTYTNVEPLGRDAPSWGVELPDWNTLAGEIKKHTGGLNDRSYDVGSVPTTRPVAMVGTRYQVNETVQGPMIMVYCSGGVQNVTVTDYYFERLDADVVMHVLFEADRVERTGPQQAGDKCKSLEHAGRGTSDSTFVWRDGSTSRRGWMALTEARSDVTFKNEVLKPDLEKEYKLRREKRNQDYERFMEKQEMLRQKRQERRAN